MSEQLKQAAAATNRALDAYVMDRVAGGERLAQLRGDLNAAFRRQYDADRAASLFAVDEKRATELVAAANQRAEGLAGRLVDVRRYALEKGDHQLAAIVAIRKPTI